MKLIAKNLLTVVMSFAGAPAAAAGTRGDGNAGEADQVAGVSGVQAQPQAAIESSDQAHPQAGAPAKDITTVIKFFAINFA